MASAQQAALPFTPDTRFRTASISKVFSAIAVMRLVDQQKLDLDHDASEYLGFSLRNPNYPDTPITLRMLMSHTSSVLDGSVYSIPPEECIEEMFLPNGKYYADGEHFTNGLDGIQKRPGTYFHYSNLNYGLIGTMFERLSGVRFDQYLKENVLEPMGLGASFNVGDFSAEELHQLSPLYQKRKDDVWNSTLPWQAQIDDYNDVPQPKNQVLITNPDLGGKSVMTDLSHYHIGDNGTVFSPQGGLRISMNELAVLAELFLQNGQLNGRQFLSEESVNTMFTPCWRYDPQLQNGDSYNGLMTCYCPGLQVMDHFLKDRRISLTGHFGEAFGLLAGLFIDRKKGNGIFYVINGQGDEDSKHPGEYSGMYRWEELLCTALLDHLFPDL